MKTHSSVSWASVISLVGLIVLVPAGCDSSGDSQKLGPPLVFMIDCQTESHQPAWLDPGRASGVEVELCIPLIRELLVSDALESVSWRMWESHFQIMVQARSGADPDAVAESLHSVLERSPLRRPQSPATGQYWIGPSPVVVQLADRPEVDPKSVAGSMSFVVLLSPEQARRFGVGIKDVREQLAAKLCDETGAVAVRLLSDTAELGQILFTTPSGASVQLRDVAEVERVRDAWARPWMTSAEFDDSVKDLSSR